MATCSRPLWDIWASSTSDPDALFLSPFCPYSIDIGLAVVGTLLMLVVFVGLLNWSESWIVPGTWLAIVSPIIAASALPGGVVRLIGGIVVFFVAAVFIGLWVWWSRG